jgi:cellulose synthase/poly-beta-1,6-N-acetylglucosamine synthase-like glycosyltransferase
VPALADLGPAFGIGCAIFCLLTVFWLRRLWVAGRYLLEWSEYRVETPPGGPVAAASSGGPVAGAPSGGPVAVCVLLPVLEETRRLEACVRRLLELGKDHPDYTVAIVTTGAEFERHERTTAHLVSLVRAARSAAEVRRLTSSFVPGSADPGSTEDLSAGPDLIRRREVAEDLILRRPTTVELARSLADRFPQVRVYHKAGSVGHLAHQLNAGVRAHLASVGAAEVLFAAYNADSRPDPRTLAWVLARCRGPARSGPAQSGPAQGDLPVVFQQYGLYLGNYFALLQRPWPARAVLTAAGLWQTRWSIGFEIFSALRQFPGGGRAVRAGRFMPRRRPILNYCIGHGLFFTHGTYLSFGGFSERTYSEDAMFGLEASYHGVPIVPVPLFESADSPETVRSLYIQKSTWFWGPLQAFRYAALMGETGQVGPGWRSRWRLTCLTLRLFEHAIIWVAGPTLAAALLGYALIARDPLRLALFIGVAELYLILPNLVALAICRRVAPEAVAQVDPGARGRILATETLRQLVGAPVAYALHGLSAYRTLARALRSWVTGVPAPKERTPLRGQAPP